MSAGITVGVSGVNRKIKAVTAGVSNVNRQIKNAWAGVSGVNRKVFAAGEPGSGLAVGSGVKFPFNGGQMRGIVVHQGLPSGGEVTYDSSCNGIWIWFKDAYTVRQWNSTQNNHYAGSTIHAYLNGDFHNLFDASIKGAIKQVKIPYISRAGSGAPVDDGAEGLSCKVFLLSHIEVGFPDTYSYVINVDGIKLSYFILGTTDDANSKRITLYNGSAVYAWLRSSVDPEASYDYTCAAAIYTTGANGYRECNTSQGVRPAFILPSDALFSSDPDSDGDYVFIS